MKNNIVVYIGGTEANELYSIIDPEFDPLCVEVDSDLISIATNANSKKKNATNILITLGTPLPSVADIPDTWKDAINELPKFDGVFCFIYWDIIAGKVVVCTDFLGLQPLYWKRNSNEIIFSSHTKIFHADYDPAGWGSFLSLGYTIGNQTLTKGVERVPPACTLTIDILTLEIKYQNYWSLDIGPRKISITDVYNALDDSMNKAIAASQFEQTLLMSGGFDSRLIACMLKQKKQSFHAIIVSHYDENLDADGRFAQAMAEKLHITYELVVPEKSFFSNKDYLEYLFASESEVPSLYLFIAQVMQFVPPTTVWDGLLPGGTLKGREGGFALFFSKRGNGYDSKIWEAAKTIFSKGTAENLWEAFQDSWKKETSNYSDDHYGAMNFFLEHRIRNRIGPNPFKVFQQKAQVLTPGVTRHYIDCAMAIPYEQKRDHKFYRQIFCKFLPEAMKVPLAHGNKIEHAKGLSLSSRFFSIASGFHNFLNNRPRLMGYLSMDPTSRHFKPSRFLDFPDVINAPDPAINSDFLRAIQQGKQVPTEFRHLLFHWRVWRWLHEGTFNERLGIDGTSKKLK
jgi:hypothetical protein